MKYINTMNPHEVRDVTIDIPDNMISMDESVHSPGTIHGQESPIYATHTGNTSQIIKHQSSLADFANKISNINQPGHGPGYNTYSSGINYGYGTYKGGDVQGQLDVASEWSSNPADWVLIDNGWDEDLEEKCKDYNGECQSFAYMHEVSAQNAAWYYKWTKLFALFIGTTATFLQFINYGL
mgnify:FL=1